MTELNRNERLSIANTATIVSKDKVNTATERINIIVINTSVSAVITIAIDEEAKAGQGIVLNPGGVWSDNSDGNYKPTQSMISAISDLASASYLSIQERSR